MPLHTRQQKWLPLGLNPHQDTATSHPGISFPEIGKVYSAEHQFSYLQPHFQALLPSYDQQSAPERRPKSSQKRFLIFDQSGNQTRLLQCVFPSSMAVDTATRLHSLKPEILLHEEHVNGKEESEMHEDTEEINALLYSDDDDDDRASDDDEVMSTGQSPFPIEQQACNKTREELDETQCSDDDGPRRKRRKLQEHSHLDQSQSFVKLPESNISRKQETSCVLSEEQSRKDKIQTTLRLLESVVPEAKGKEAVLLLDEAIDYLKLLKRNLNSSKHLLFD